MPNARRTQGLRKSTFDTDRELLMPPSPAENERGPTNTFPASLVSSQACSRTVQTHRSSSHGPNSSNGGSTFLRNILKLTVARTSGASQCMLRATGVRWRAWGDYRPMFYTETTRERPRFGCGRQLLPYRPCVRKGRFALAASGLSPHTLSLTWGYGCQRTNLHIGLAMISRRTMAFHFR